MLSIACTMSEGTGGSNLVRDQPLRLLRRLVFDFLLQRLPDGFVADEALFIRRLLARRIEARHTFRNLSDRFLLAHRSLLFKPASSATGRCPAPRRSLRLLSSRRRSRLARSG